MNALQLAQAAYTGREAPTRSQRGVEYDVFAQVTQRLRTAHARREADFPSLVAALHENRQLWTHLVLLVADDMNGLPTALRAQLASLGIFTDGHTSKVLARQASAEILIEINTAIMRGLRPQGLAA